MIKQLYLFCNSVLPDARGVPNEGKKAVRKALLKGRISTVDLLVLTSLYKLLLYGKYY